MNKTNKLLFFLSFLLLNTGMLKGQVSINQNNTPPDQSAMLDVQSDSKGILIPRMTTVQRLDIANPATGLLVYDFDEDNFWFYDGSIWHEIQSEESALIIDADGDTKVQVEENPDEDLIRFDLEGDEMFSLAKNDNGDLLMQTRASSSNIIIGNDTGDDVTGVANILIGNRTGESLTTGERNSIIGPQAGLTLTDGNYNTFIGTIAGVDIESGIGNIIIGDSAGAGRDTASYNTYIGFASGTITSGSDLDTSNFNTFLGSNSGLNASGNANLLLGYLTGGDSNALGDNNTIVGTAAGQLTEGNGHVFLGFQAGSLQTGDNKLHIHNGPSLDPLIYGEFDNEILKINGSLTSTETISAENGIQFPFAADVDDTYIGSEGNYLSFGHDGQSADFLGYTDNTFYFRNSLNGPESDQPDVYASAFNTYSSQRWKHSIENIDNAIDIIKNIRGVSYIWNEDHGGKNDFGFIAEEINEILPHIAPKNKDGEVDGLDYAKLTPFLVEAVKDQQEQIEKQQKLIDELLAFRNEILIKLEKN